MSVVQQCISDFLTATQCEEFHGKWIPTISWQHILFNTTDKDYSKKAVTRALMLTKSDLESVSTSVMKMSYAKKYIQSSLPDKNLVKEHVSFFYIQESNRESPKIDSDVAIWQERYYYCVSRYDRQQPHGQYAPHSENCSTSLIVEQNMANLESSSIQLFSPETVMDNLNLDSVAADIEPLCVDGSPIRGI